jgi:hypothetical protein
MYSPEAIQPSPEEKKPPTTGFVFQFIALAFAVPAMAWGIFMVGSTAFPTPCGDSLGFLPLGVAECWLVGLPTGLFALARGLYFKGDSPRLGRI